MIKVTELKYSTLLLALTLAGLSGCNKTSAPNQAQVPAATTVAPDSDPASGNLAPLPANAQTEQQNPQDYSNASYDLPTDAQDYPADYAYDNASNQPPVQATSPPPPLPDYSQPPCPGDGYYWTPGYWGYTPNNGYYWVPGAWVLAPWVGALWTPPYWDFEDGYYRWHPGYWGPHVGFYGGIDYGFGYNGRGYYGAYWDKNVLRYNREVTNAVPGVVGSVYGYSAPRGSGSRVSYNGGRGGIDARPTPQEMAVVHDPRTPPVAAQVSHARQAAGNRLQFASAGHAPEALAEPNPLPASYKAPAARPPAAAMRLAARPPAPAPHPEAHPAQPEVAQRPGPENRPAPENRPEPVAARPEAHPAPQSRPEAAPRPEVRPENRPAPVASRPEAHPAPQSRPEVAPRPEARPENRPAPVASRPAPERPAAPRPEPVARPAVPQRPAPEARPAPAPRPEAHPPARPAPPVKPEEEKKG